MPVDARSILENLAAVDQLREELAVQPALARRTFALKDYQARRFERTYRDLLAHRGEYRDASLFFLEEIYAAKAFTRRDEQFARIVPSLTRIFSGDVVSTVSTLAELHATTERLDVAMACHLPDTAISGPDYLRAWQLCGKFDQRWRQIAMTLEVGRSLSHHTRSATVRRLLRIMRSPARVAGLGELQRFLERGFETFARLRDPGIFLRTIEQRESAIVAALSATDSLPSPLAKRDNISPLDDLP